MKRNIGTVCVHGKNERKDTDKTGAVSFPIYQSATFVHPAFDYSRLQNPTREEVERIVNDLEEGVDALAFSTGMAALTEKIKMIYIEIPTNPMMKVSDIQEISKKQSTGFGGMVSFHVDSPERAKKF